MNLSSQNKISVFGLFHDRIATEVAFDHLKQNGFSGSDISVLMTDEDTPRSFAFEKHSKAPEGASFGMLLGVLLGGSWGWLAGSGLINNPDLADFFVAGPFMSTMAGIGFGVCSGGLIGAIIGFSVPEFVARRYRGLAKQAGILMSVHCDSHELVHRAKELLKNDGARGVTTAPESRP